MTKFVLPLGEFNRIHQLIHGAIRAEGNPGRACTLFACIGALILNKHYNIKSRAVAGGFAMCVEPEKNLFFGRDAGGRLEMDTDAFHMWIQTPTHIIDFMSPLYQEAFAEVQAETTIPRKMFQKRHEAEAAGLDKLKAPGDFYVMPDTDLTEHLIDSILERDINRDFFNIVDHWFGKRRGKQRPTLTIGSNDGIIRDLKLPTTVALGSW